MRRPARIRLYCGTFESQRLVFAHLWDSAPRLDFDHVEVICRQDPMRRLCHYMDRGCAQRIADGMGLETTLVMLLPGAGELGSSERLRSLGEVQGSRIMP